MTRPQSLSEQWNFLVDDVNNSLEKLQLFLCIHKDDLVKEMDINPRRLRQIIHNLTANVEDLPR
jgi:hypothetical protein